MNEETVARQERRINARKQNACSRVRILTASPGLDNLQYMDVTYKHWVKAYSQCVIPDVFMKLAEFVRKDVEALKCHSPLRARGFEFKLEPDEVTEKTKQITVTQYRTSKSDTETKTEKITVTFTREDDAILVKSSLNGFARWTIKWNLNTVECDLLLDGQPPPDQPSYPLWQLSYYALSPLFFHQENA